MYYSWMVLFFLVIYQVLFALSSRHSVDMNVKSNMETEEHSDSLRDYAGVHKFPWMPSRIHLGNKQADVSSFISSKGFGDWTLGGLISLGNKYWRGLSKWASRIGSDSLDGQPSVAGYNWTSDDILDILYVGDGDLPPVRKEEIGDRTTEGKVVTDEGMGDSTTEGKVVTDERVGETTEGKVVKAVNEGGIGEWTFGGKPVQQKEKESKDIMDVVAALHIQASPGSMEYRQYNANGHINKFPWMPSRIYHNDDQWDAMRFFKGGKRHGRESHTAGAGLSDWGTRGDRLDGHASYSSVSGGRDINAFSSFILPLVGMGNDGRGDSASAFTNNDAGLNDWVSIGNALTGAAYGYGASGGNEDTSSSKLEPYHLFS